MAEYKLPDVGEGLIEAEIVSWKVKEGDTVAINDVIVEIETAKSIVELPSPYAGTVTALLVAEGETVEVGTPIVAIGDPAEAGDGAGENRGLSPNRDLEGDSPAVSHQSTPPGRPTDSGRPPQGEIDIDLSNPASSGSMEGASLVGRMKADRGPQRRARRGAASPGSDAGAATQMQVQGAFSPGGAQSQEVAPAEESPVPATDARTAVPAGAGEPDRTGSPARPLATPPVRKLAKDLGIDLATLTGSGPQGSITRADVQAAQSHAAQPAQAAPRPQAEPVGARAASEGARETREPIKGVRRMMAGAMVESAFTAPHVTEWITVDVTGSTAFLERLRGRREFRELKVSPLLLLARASMLAMRRTPEINSWWDEQAQEVVYKRYVNLGIAAATPRGLVVPNIKDADSLGLADLARALGELTETARAGKTQPADMSGGTFTITNVGVFGVDAGTPIINPGESAILCFGATTRRPWVVGEGAEERLEIRDVCTLALSFDHRHIDGQKGSAFLADVAGIMRDPASAMLF